MDTGEASARADQVGRKAEQSDALHLAVRVGLISYGVVHLLIAWLAAQLALGDRAGSASGSGALAELAQKPFGTILLWIVGLGFFALVVWQLIESAFGHRSDEGNKRLAKRIASAGKAVVYGVLGVSALKVAIGSGGRESDDTDTLTARLMSMPFGTLLVGLVGAVVLAIAAGHVYRGLAEDFRDHLRASGSIGTSGKLYISLGKAGYVAKGVALGVVAGLFIYAAWTHDPEESGGLDQALRTVLEQSYGAPLLLLIAAGVACYGLFCFAWARHLNPDS
jgi:hypothetical protein